MKDTEITQKEIVLIHDVVFQNNEILKEASEEKVFEFVARLIEKIQFDRLKEEIFMHKEE